MYSDGTNTAKQCSGGTYYTKTGATKQADCIPCLAGYMCDWSVVLLIPDDPTKSSQCRQNYYCRDGVEIECPAGHMCPTSGMASPLACPVGTYQHQTGQSSCLDCPAGKFCAEKDPIGVDVVADDSDRFKCPLGFYCPLKTYNKYKYPCPRGSYGSTIGLSDSSQCEKCWPGKACERTGITVDDKDATPDCAAGYHCSEGAAHITDGELCQLGYYCEAGHSEYTDDHKCPVDTYGKVEGLASVDECSPCKGGRNCNDSGITSDTIDDEKYDCEAGNYCNPSNTPVQQQCPAGYKCPNKNMDKPEPCSVGEYQTDPGQTECEQCPAGKVCNYLGESRPKENLDPCPAGWFCPIGSHSTCSTDDRFQSSICSSPIQLCSVAKQCPEGSEEAKVCDDGFYALARGQDSCDQCPAGIVCDGADATETEPYKKCPAGHYCLAETSTAGTNQPVECPPGTYSTDEFIPVFGLKSASECSPCPGGHFCLGGDHIEPCKEGTYCQFDVSSMSIDNSFGIADITL